MIVSNIGRLLSLENANYVIYNNYSTVRINLNKISHGNIYSFWRPIKNHGINYYLNNCLLLLLFKS